MQTSKREDRREIECLTTEIRFIDVNETLRPEDVDLRKLVSHQTAVRISDTVESVFTSFGESGREFAAVLDGPSLAGLCSRHQISQLLSGRYGFALWARKPIGQHLSMKETRVSVTTPIGTVLKEVFARANDVFYDDILLVDEDGLFLGLITTQTLFKVQNALMQTNIRDLVERDREIAVRNEQMENDLQMAMELQQAFMSVTYPVFSRQAASGQSQIRFSHLYVPSNLIGGDFFYIVRVSDSCAGIFICDVMGHGVRSALVTSMLRALIEGLGPKAAEPGDLMTHLNSELTSILKQMGTTLFVTAFYCTLDSALGQLRFASAGHPHSLNIRGNGSEIERLASQSGTNTLALGLLAGTHYGTTSVSLAPGDRVFLFTDGIVEAEDLDGNQFGEDRLIESLRRNLCRNSLSSLIEDAHRFANDNQFADDVCLLMMQWLPEP